MIEAECGRMCRDVEDLNDHEDGCRICWDLLNPDDPESPCHACGGDGWVFSVAEVSGRWGWDTEGVGDCPNCGGSGNAEDCTVF